MKPANIILLLAIIALVVALCSCTVEPFHIHGRDITSLGATLGTKSTQSDLLASAPDGTKLESHRKGHDETQIPAIISNEKMLTKGADTLTTGVRTLR